MSPMEVIPVARTASPYSLTEAVSELTANTAGTDTASLNQSLDTLSATLDQLRHNSVRRSMAYPLSRRSTTATTRWANY